MKFIGKIIFHTIANAIAFLVAAHFVTGFTLTGDIITLVVTALILTTLNTFLRPLLKLFFGPFLFITLGLFSIVINALILHFLDIWSTALTIEGILPLVWGTLIITAVNIVFIIPEKIFFRK